MKSYTFSTTVSELLDIVGRDKAKDYVETTTAQANQITEYENSKANIAYYWLRISVFAVVFSCLAVIFLEFIDKDIR